MRLEIQGLRAIAVLAVLVYHLWPEALPGGYVGVDVFFVLSGYLITDLIIREIEATGRLSLLSFYGRRIRRLLPVATVVILTSTAFFWVLPRVQWVDVGWDAVAGVLYIQNWRLAYSAFDYLAAENNHGFLQHYWSLSVEEQFYIFWPLLIGLSLISIRNKRKRQAIRRRVFVMIIAVTAISLHHSIQLTTTYPPVAYLATTTRAWELGFGGLLAISGASARELPASLSCIFGWVGLGMVCGACLIFDSYTPFPGYVAVLPVLGTMLVIAFASRPGQWSPYELLRIRPLQFLGDISYSLYLWHWPIIITYKAAKQVENIHWYDGLGLALIAILLSCLSKRFVEDPIRYGRLMSRRPIAGPGVIVIVSILAVFTVAAKITLLSAAPKERLTLEAPKLALGHIKNRHSQTIPSLETVRQDNPEVYKLGCHTNQFSSDLKSCSFGPQGASNIIALVGDSHAAQWVPLLQEIYRGRPNWRLVTFTKSACPFNSQTLTIENIKGPYESCVEWNNKLLSELRKLKPRIVVLGQSATYKVYGVVDPFANFEALTEGTLTRWGQMLEAGTTVVAIRDTPRMNEDVPACLSTSGNTIEDCSTARDKAMKADPVVAAVRRRPAEWGNLFYVDLTDEICGKSLCEPLRGQVLIYRDSHHLTATFSRSLAHKLRFQRPFLPE